MTASSHDLPRDDATAVVILPALLAPQLRAPDGDGTAILATGAAPSPAAVYLARLAPTGRRTQELALHTMAALLSRARYDAFSFPFVFWLGVGLTLVVGGFALRHGADIRSRGALGRWTARVGIAAPIFLLLSLVIEFAIVGTLVTFAAILMFTVLVHRSSLLPRLDGVLLSVATIASITWNTETPSAALLIIVGLVASWVSYRALVAGCWGHVPTISK